MDTVYLAGFALLWGLTALLVFGLKKLDRPDGGRP
jgi:hypothetical protein